MSQREDVKLGVMLDNPAEAIARIGGDVKPAEDAVTKAMRLLDELEREEASLQKGADSEDPVAKANRLMDEVERSNDPAYVTKRVREDALAKWRAEPLPPKTFGAGMAHLPAENVEAMAKARGFGMKEADYFRKL
jgi:hypothetical protein